MEECADGQWEKGWGQIVGSTLKGISLVEKWRWEAQGRGDRMATLRSWQLRRASVGKRVPLCQHVVRLVFWVDVAYMQRPQVQEALVLSEVWKSSHSSLKQPWNILTLENVWVTWLEQFWNFSWMFSPGDCARGFPLASWYLYECFDSAIDVFQTKSCHTHSFHSGQQISKIGLILASCRAWNKKPQR